MSFRNERLNARFLSLNELAKSVDPDKARIFSDRGKGADRICRDIDHDDERDAERELALDNQNFVYLMVAEGFLVLCDLERLIPVLELVVENGRCKQESIVRLCRRWRKKKDVARVMYHQGVRALLTIFSPNEIKGETHVGKR